MGLSKDTLAAITAAVKAALAAEGTSRPTRGSSRAKVARDSRTMAERRADGVGGVCSCEQRFATRNGAAYHIAHNDDTHELA